MGAPRRFASLPGHVWQQIDPDLAGEPDDTVWPAAPTFGVETDPELWPEDLPETVHTQLADSSGSAGDDERWRSLIQRQEPLATLGDIMQRRI